MEWLATGEGIIGAKLMDAKRFFIDKKDIEQDFITIKGAEFTHLSKVLRYKVGYDLIACDNSGYDYFAKLASIEKDYAQAQIYAKEWNNTETKREIVLCQAVCKELDFIVQKAVELGVGKCIPFTSEFTNIKQINLERLQKVALNASKQCGRAKLMEISSLFGYEHMLETIKMGEVVLFYEESLRELKVNGGDTPLYIVVGSEGGFSKAEIEKAHSLGISDFSLGKRVLRAETAAVAGMVLSLAQIGELS